MSKCLARGRRSAWEIATDGEWNGRRPQSRSRARTSVTPCQWETAEVKEVLGTGRGHVAALIFTKDIFREDVKRAEWRSGCFIGGGVWSPHTESDLFSFVSQGIEWTHIDYFNNAIICDLIENVSIGYSFLKNCLIIISHLKWSHSLQC